MTTEQSNNRGELGADRSGTALVVDDEPQLVGMYAAMLEDVHTVRTATSGEETLDRLEADVDVVLLDRRMPDLSGDEVLRAIRGDDCEYQVALVTSAQPDMDVADLPFDAYVVKPVRQRDLRDLVDDLLLRSEYSSGVQELLRVSSRIAALETQLDEDELRSRAEYQTLRERKERLETASRDRQETLVDREDGGFVFRDVLGEVIDDE